MFLLEMGEAVGTERLPHHRCRTGHAHQGNLGLGQGGRVADDLDDLVDVGQCQQLPFHHVLPLAGLPQQVLGPATNNRLTMTEELLQDLLDVERAGFSIDQRQQDDGNCLLQRGELVELVENHFRIGIPLDIDHQADRILEVTHVPDIRDAGDLATVDQPGNALHHAIPVLLVGDFLDNDPRLVALLLDFGAGTDNHRSPPGVIPLANATSTTDDPAGRKIRPRYDFQQLVNTHLGVVDDLDQGITDLAKVVWWNGSCHSNRDPVGAVNQQVGKLGRENCRLHAALVVGRCEVDRVELDIVQQQCRDG